MRVFWDKNAKLLHLRPRKLGQVVRLVLPAYTRLPHLRDIVGKLAGEPWVLDKPSGETVFTGTQGPLRSLRLSPAPVDEADPMARAWLSFRAADGMRRN